MSYPRSFIRYVRRRICCCRPHNFADVVLEAARITASRINDYRDEQARLLTDLLDAALSFGAFTPIQLTVIHPLTAYTRPPPTMEAQLAREFGVQEDIVRALATRMQGVILEAPAAQAVF